jgi:cysteine synthase
MTIPVVGPTYEEMLHPWKIDKTIRETAKKMAKEDPLHPINLFNITWRNPDDSYRYFVLPKALTGVDANIVVLVAKDFPSGSHKVGPTYSVLAEMTVTGAVDPTYHTLVWPSTGNYGVGGAWVSARMKYKSLVILPEEMSEERFEIIRRYGSEVIATPGCESNVKEIYDKTHELKKESPDTIRILNQFDSFANYRFHEYVTGGTMVELVRDEAIGNKEIAAVVLTVGSGGTIASGDRVKQEFPHVKIVAGEPVQCPTLSLNGYGGHDIQGIGDKHVTWIHNVMNMDGVVLIDDMDAKHLLKLFTSEVGKKYLGSFLPAELIEKLSSCLGISGCANIIAAIKTAKYYDFKAGENVMTVATDSLDRYYSVMRKMPDYNECKAAAIYERLIQYQSASDFFEGGKFNRLRWHNLKYYTWIEQQGKDVEELNLMKDQDFWKREASKVKEMDKKIIKWRTEHAEMLRTVWGC